MDAAMGIDTNVSINGSAVIDVDDELFEIISIMKC
jgi:hypothetical protein